MNKRASYRSIDLVVVAVANLMNIIMVVVFLLRSMMVERLQVVGFIWAAFILVLAAVVARFLFCLWRMGGGKKQLTHSVYVVEDRDEP